MGFDSDDGKWVQCSREEFAGSLRANDAGLFPHVRHGKCNCGTEHSPALEWDVPREASDNVLYDYVDEYGNLAYQVVRKPDKRFMQRRPDGRGGWLWELNGITRIPFRLPELLAAPRDAVVLICEGEKDVNTAVDLGFVATCNPGGAGKWSWVQDTAARALAGRSVCVVADADDVGRKHANDVAAALQGVAKSVVVVEMPAPHKDLTDAVRGGLTAADLLAMTRVASSAPAAGLPGMLVEAPASWWSERPPKRRHLLTDPRKTGAPGVVPLGKTGLFIGEGGVSKTMALVQLALSVATGTRWLGTFDVASPGKVLLVLGEEDQEESWRRIYYAARAAHVGYTPNISVLALQGRPSSMLVPDDSGRSRAVVESQDYRDLLGLVTRMTGLSLIVLDPLSRFAGPEAETDNAAATRFMQLVESLSGATGATTIVAHHTAKTGRGGGAVGTDASRGSSALTDGARFVCTLGHHENKGLQEGDRERLERTVRLSFGKSNYTRLADMLQLRRSDDNMGALVALDETDLEAIGAVSGVTDKQAVRSEALGQKYAAQEQTVLRLVSERMPDGISRNMCSELVKKACSCGSDAAWSAVKRALALGLVRTKFDDGDGNLVLP